MMTRHSHSYRSAQTARSGNIVPAVAVALLVIGAAIALALNRAWIDGAQVELTTATDAAALAAARELAGDDLLRSGIDASGRVAAARLAAVQVAALNTVAGQPVQLAPGDVHFGRVVLDSTNGMNVFLESESDPRSVVVWARRERSRGNPVGLLMSGLTGVGAADLGRLATATIDNNIVGVRASANIQIPALPLAILESDSSGMRPDTWQAQIVQRRGNDQFSFDPATGAVERASDGIPEIVLTTLSVPTGGRSDIFPNVCLVDFTGGWDPEHLVEMIKHGISSADLANFNSELLLPGTPVSVPATALIGGPAWDALNQNLGQCRICFLYQNSPAAAGSAAPSSVVCTGLVAGRVMQTAVAANGALQIVFQPGVIVTRAAETIAQADLAGDTQGAVTIGNPYIFKMTLTR